MNLKREEQSLNQVINETKLLSFIEIMDQATILFSNKGDLLFVNAPAKKTFRLKKNFSLNNSSFSFLSRKLIQTNGEYIEDTSEIDGTEYFCCARRMHFGDLTFFIETVESLKTPKEEKNEIVELNNIIDSLRDGIYITDEKGFTLQINKKYSEMTGISREDVIGHHVSELIYKGFFDDSITLKVLENKKAVSILQKTKEGDQIWLVTGNPIFNSKGTITKIFNTVYDMTELNQLRESLKNKETANKKQKVELQKLREQITGVPGLIGNSEPIKKIKTVINKISKIDSSILILGETGSGKNVVARAIHDLSNRASKPFIEVNCGALPEHLIESELFGYAGGAFTGANKGGKTGLLEVAHQGTVFLDEIGEMPQHLQVKLLTFLQDQRVRRIGESSSTQVDLKIIAATNKDLEKLIAEKKFREDLYYRLSVVPIKLPALREHKEDIYLLINYFSEIFNQKHNCNVKLSKAAYLSLENYKWPGNVRELKHLIEQLIVLADENIITINDLPDHISSNSLIGLDHHSKTLNEIVNNVELQIIKEAWEELKDVNLVANRLGMHRTTLMRKVNKLGVKLKENAN